MTYSKAFAPIDFRDVQPLLVRSSGGSNPQAAVAWEELQTAIANFVDESVLERAIASLFHDVLLTGGITEQRAAIEGSDLYYFTRFEINLPALTGNQLWATRRITDDALLDANGNQIGYSYNFKVTGNGLFTVEFQSASNNPVVADGQYTLVVQRRPGAAHSPTIILPKNTPFTFDNGIILEFSGESGYLARNAAGENFLVGPTSYWTATQAKVSREKGFAIIGDDGLYYRSTLSPTAILPPELITLAEYDAF